MTRRALTPADQLDFWPHLAASSVVATAALPVFYSRPCRPQPRKAARTAGAEPVAQSATQRGQGGALGIIGDNAVTLRKKGRA